MSATHANRGVARATTLQIARAVGLVRSLRKKPLPEDLPPSRAA